MDKSLISEETSLRQEYILNQNFSNLTPVLSNMNFTQRSNFSELIDWLKYLIPNFDDLAIQSSQNEGKIYLSFSEKNWNHHFRPLNWSSDGVIHVICILAILFNKIKPSIIILDEFENGLHPAIIREMNYNSEDLENNRHEITDSSFEKQILKKLLKSVKKSYNLRTLKPLIESFSNKNLSIKLSHYKDFLIDLSHFADPTKFPTIN